MDEDYREILAELDNLDELLEMVDEAIDMTVNDSNPGDAWVCIDHSNLCCTFANCFGEIRCIGAQYIDACFDEV